MAELMNHPLVFFVVSLVAMSLAGWIGFALLRRRKPLKGESANYSVSSSPPPGRCSRSSSASASQWQSAVMTSARTTRKKKRMQSAQNSFVRS
jgi:hypothetical protein